MPAANAIPPGVLRLRRGTDLNNRPHKTVRENIAFPLGLAGPDKAEIDAYVHAAASIRELEACLYRKPQALSGGQRQRASMGRAEAREPAVFLLDEPQSNLDAKLGVQMFAARSGENLIPAGRAGFAEEG